MDRIYSKILNRKENVTDNNLNRKKENDICPEWLWGP